MKGADEPWLIGPEEQHFCPRLELHLRSRHAENPGAGPHPVLIDIHGGPESQARPGFSAWRRYLVETLGIAVLRPNVRGSTGYGKAYTKLDNGFRRLDSVRDIEAVLDWIDHQPQYDAQRVGVKGASYGGYMALASAVHFSHRLRAVLDAVGISNFVSFLEGTSNHRRDRRRVEYGDEHIPEMRNFLRAISPTQKVDCIRVPMFISQGANDPRVPAAESQQIVDALRAPGA